MNEQTSLDILLDYEKRLLAIGPTTVQISPPREEWTGIGFQLAGIKLLADMTVVTEIIDPLHCTPVPGTKPWLIGIANLRGGLLPVTDLHSLITGQPIVPSKDSMFLICGQEGDQVALKVDSILGMKRFYTENKSTIASPDISFEKIKSFITQAYTEHQEVWPIFDITRFINNQSFLAVSA